MLDENKRFLFLLLTYGGCMKKILVLLVAAIIGSASIFAQTDSGTIRMAGLDFQFPKTEFDVDVDGITATNEIDRGIVFSASLLVIKQTGLTFGGRFGLGFFEVEDYLDGSALGTRINLEGELGYSFIRTDKYTLSLLGTLDMDYGYISDTYQGIKATSTYTILGVGADLCGTVKLGKSFGLKAGFALHTMSIGSLNEKVEGTSSGIKITLEDDYDIEGGLTTSPYFGLCWRF